MVLWVYEGRAGRDPKRKEETHVNSTLKKVLIGIVAFFAVLVLTFVVLVGIYFFAPRNPPRVKPRCTQITSAPAASIWRVSCSFVTKAIVNRSK